jgi:CheY-like chemotaxis protein
MATKRVLLIDDEDDVRQLAQISLERIGGFEVLVARSGEEGIAMALEQRPDAILLDARMAAMDGAQTLERLRERPQTADIPVVFLTGSVQAHERERFLSLGAVAVLNKPFDPMALAQEVRDAFGWPDAG